MQKFEQVAFLVKQGLGYNDLVKQVPFENRTQAYNAVALAKRHGLLPRDKHVRTLSRRLSPTTGRNIAAYHLAGTTKKLGSMEQLLNKLPPDVIQKLVKETPGHGTVAELIGSIIIDAFE